MLCIFRILLSFIWRGVSEVGWKVTVFTRGSSCPPFAGHCCHLNGIMCIRKVSESELKITFTSGRLPLPHVNTDWHASTDSLLPQPWLEFFFFPMCPFMKNWFHLTHISARILLFLLYFQECVLINSLRFSVIQWTW